MTVIWNPHLIDNFADGSLDLTSSVIGMALVYSTSIPTDTTPDTIDGLLNFGNFQELAGNSYTRTTTPVTQTAPDTSGVIKIVMGLDFSPTQTEPAYVAAGVFYVVGTKVGIANPWLFITDDMFGNVMTPGARVGTSEHPKVLFSYLVRGGTSVDLSLGHIVQSPGPTTWESARIQHIYLHPQRINFIPNPSFEDVGRFGWRSDGTLSRLPGGVDNPANFYGRTSGTIIESLGISPQGPMRFSAYVRAGSATQITFGLRCMDPSFQQVSIQWGKTRILGANWARYDDIIFPADDSTTIIPRIQADGGFDFDLVLLEAGEALHDYFDGDSQTGMPYDFSWRGAQAQSYSCYYTNRYTTAARLFGDYQDGQVTKPCLVLDWVPSGTAIFAHWDVLGPNDTKNVLKDWNPKVFVP